MGSQLWRAWAVSGAAVLAMAVMALSCAAQSAPASQPAAKPASTPADAAPVFDVAMIRPNPGDTTGHSHIWSSASDGHFKAQNVTVLQLIQAAYAIADTRISGGPGWMRSSRFDMEAKADPSLDSRLQAMPSADAREQKRRMLQALLADRFGLKVHDETRVLPIYVLVVAKGGARFLPSKINGTTINSGRSQITVSGSDHTLTLLAEVLSRTLGRIVVDKTGIDGRFELKLSWTPDEAASSGPGQTPSLDAGNAPSLFTAIQEQLGLKLESDEGPVPILVIDQIALPSEN